ncbi:amidohydrolase (plasmid) [Rufibacter tibetensis]|uniref:Amidohydrolase n=1 Tax=Rufibacter tibetensis TaxID=512763 RepID=A0A0P0C9G3_9BACT|nr:amidohydrolase [Rufibacter tibetensis]
MRIDAHQHFWQFDPIRDSWITEEMSLIQRDFLPEDLEPVLKRHGFDGCVLVQSAQPENENAFLLEAAQQHGFVKGVVGWVDLMAENVEERLASYTHHEKLKGFRYILQGDPDRAIMLRPEFKRGISHLREYGYTYDVLIYPDQLVYAADLVGAFPDQPFVIDHLAKPYIRSGEVEQWKRDIKSIARYGNVWCKVSGLVTEADWRNWNKGDFIPYLESAVEAFGVERLMYGSDWPVCLVAGAYGEILGIVEEYFSSFSKTEQAALLGGNAASFYHLT